MMTSGALAEMLAGAPAEVGRVVTAGETMVLAAPEHPERLRHAASLRLSIGGAESNVAIALARLGVPSAWVSLLGDDELGATVLARVRAEGVDTHHVRRTDRAPTGFYLRERVGNRHRVHYLRRGSAASLMAPEDVDPAWLEGAALLHLSGVTPALSPSAAAFFVALLREARRQRVPVSLDVNFRSKLWSAAQARAFLDPVLAEVTVLFVGHDEAVALWDDDEEAVAKELAGRGPREVVLKRGAAGSLVHAEGRVEEAPGFAVAELDPVGAGDAFAAGYLAARLWGLELPERLLAGNALGALGVATLGDYEGLPDRGELAEFLAGHTHADR